MVIKKAQFTISSPTVNQCPQDNKPEYAFIGRSNVGKSSLINMLCNHKGLAKTSATPGKTLLINYFIINNEWYLVDLPGYGYAQRSKTTQQKIRQMIESYVLQRQQHPFGTAKNRPGIHRLAWAITDSLYHRLHQG